MIDVDDGARGVDRLGEVVVVAIVEVREPTRQEDGVEIAGNLVDDRTSIVFVQQLGVAWLAVGGHRFGIDHVFRPQHEIDVTIDQPIGIEVAL